MFWNKKKLEKTKYEIFFIVSFGTKKGTKIGEKIASFGTNKWKKIGSVPVYGSLAAR